MELKVLLINAFEKPLDTAVATARTCYSPKGIVYPRDIIQADSERERHQQIIKRNRLAKSLYLAGHHTTFQHAHFQFAIQGVSRLFVWSFLHHHPFYNSEQVSQRYVEVSPSNFYIPKGLHGDALSTYIDTIEFLMQSYKKLTKVLLPVVEEEFVKRFPNRSPEIAKWRRTIKKKALEIARYVLPLASQTYLHHTISALTLMRYYMSINHHETQEEAKEVVNRMVDEVLRLDPDFKVILERPIPEDDYPETPIFSYETGYLSDSWKEDFDRSLQGKKSKLISFNVNNEEILASAVREVLCVPKSELSDDEAIELVLNPSRNPLLGFPVDITYHYKVTRAMAHVFWTFRKKLSHSADSQDQRHRMTPGSRPYLKVPTEPDYVVPQLIRLSKEASKIYHRVMETLWERLAKMKRIGVPAGIQLYLLPNAIPVRFTESFDLLAFRHKAKMRLCYNAQEEIWQATLQEVMQIKEINPRVGRFLLPPCTVRKLAKKRPYCPEGARYCGVPVWNLDLDEFSRTI